MMPDRSRRLPLRLEQKLGEIALQYARRQRLRGRVRFGGAFLGLLLALGLALYLLEGTPIPPVVPSGITLVLLAILWVRWLYYPLRQRISRKQIALFIDEHNPELENLTVSSVEFSQEDYDAASDWMVEHVLEDAKTLAEKAPLSDLVDRDLLKRLAVAGACLWLAAVGVLGVYLYRWDLKWDGFFSWRTYEGAPFAVEPGNIRVRLGVDQVVWVTTDASDQRRAIRWRTPGGDWQSGALLPSSSDGVFYFQLRNLQEDTEYQVQVGRRRSEVYTVRVWTPPEVVSITLTYHYPDYLGLPSREAPDGGDITAPEGTEVDLDVEVNTPLSNATLMLASGERVGLSEVATLVWHGRLSVTRDDKYHIELRNPEGEESEYNREYRIVAKEDKPPEVQIRFPRGDDEATALEEIPFGFSVSDDYGLKGYGLQYEVAGRTPVRMDMSRGETGLTEANGDYLLALEGLDLSAGDFITWTIWAEDGKPGREAFELLGDPYFLEIRPFNRSFSEAVSNQGGEAGAGGQREATNQKQVLIATWNLRKTAKDLDEQEFDERRSAIFEAQQEVLASALENRSGGTQRQALIAGLQEEVAGALEALAEAAFPSPERSLSDALGHQQRAYHYLLQLEPDRVAVMQSRGAGGAGGGAQRELDGLELTQRRDFREAASTLKEQLAETEQARNRIEELAKRQAFINNDIARLISKMASLEGEEREAAKRKLERLQEEQRRNLAALDAVSGEIASGDMDPRQARGTQQQLDDARQQMSRSARSMEEDRLQRARAAGSRALDALNQARTQLQNLSRSAAGERMAGLQEGMDSLRARQARIVEQTREQVAREAGRAKSLAAAEQETAEILAAKQGLADAFKAFMDEAGELAEKSAGSQGLMSQKLGDWLRLTSREGIYEDMLKGERYVRYGAWGASLDLEEGVEEKLTEASERLDAVSGHLVKDDLEGMEKALEQLQTLMEGEGETEGDWGPQSPDELRRFAEGGYRDWVEAIRNAEALLPDENETGRRLAGIREDIDALRRRYGREKAPPQYELVFDRATKPLTLAAEELRREIKRLRSEYEFAPANDGEVPAQYRDHVAEYFKALSELKGK